VPVAADLLGQRGDVMRELVLRSDVLLLACREAVAWERDAGLLHELAVGELRQLGEATPLRTEIGVVRAPGRTITPASELLLHQVLDVASRVLATPAIGTLARDVDAKVDVPA
jgi:hypothetical protein